MKAVARVDRRRRRRRAGVSLIELVILIGCTTIILGTCGVFLHLLLKLDRAGRDSQRDIVAVSRLARQYRRDVTRAATVQATEPGQCDLSFGDGTTVAYRPEPGRLVRTESRAGAVVRRESYAFTRFQAARFESASDHRMALVLARRDDAGGQPLRPGYRVEATVGRDAQIGGER